MIVYVFRMILCQLSTALKVRCCRKAHLAHNQRVRPQDVLVDHMEIHLVRHLDESARTAEALIRAKIGFVVLASDESRCGVLMYRSMCARAGSCDVVLYGTTRILMETLDSFRQNVSGIFARV